MNDNFRILGVIPARGGSKGIHQKNITLLNGKPLIAYSIESALNSNYLTDVIVSTEDPQIAVISEKFGAKVPFIRPEELATDMALSLPVIQHATREMEKLNAANYDLVLMLQPTTPFRTSQDIDTSIKLLTDSNADSVLSVVEVNGHHPFRMKRITEDNWLTNYIDQGFEDMRPRQVLPPVYLRSGAIYLMNRDLLMEGNSLVGPKCKAYIISQERAVNIDTPMDLLMAEMILKDNTFNEHLNS